jgi:hypothetical protein
MKTENSSYNIDLLLNSIRNFNPSIGNYQQHTMLEDTYTYSIKVSNGSLRVYMEELQDETTLPNERLKDIAARFIEK